MIKIIYIGKENKRRINTLYKIKDVSIDIMEMDNCESVINKLTNEVIDLFIMNREDRCIEICCLIKKEKRLQQIPIISLVTSLDDIVCQSDMIVSENVSDLEFLYQIKTLIKMKLIDDELNKEKIMLELKVKDRTIELEKKEERFRNMFDNMKSAVAIYKTNDSGKTFFFNGWNKRAKELENINVDDLMGKKLEDIFPFAVTSGFVNYIRKVWENGKSIQVPDFYYESEDGKIKGWRSNFLYKNFVTNEIVSIYDDITIRKETEESIRRSEFRLRRAELTAKSGNWELHVNSQKIIASEGAIKLYGLSSNIFDYDAIKTNVLPEYREMMDNAMKNLLNNDTPYEVEFKIKTSDTCEIKHIYSTAIYDKEKNIVFGVIRDTTSQKKTEDKLDKTISLLKATLESTAEGVLVVDFNGNVIQFNKRFIEMWRMPEYLVNERDDSKLLKYVTKQVKYPKEFMNKVQELYADHNNISFDVIEFSDGRFFDRYSIPQKINDKAIGRVWSFRDITDKKESEMELIKAKEKAEESDKLKSEFLSSMTHEIRTPMNAILGFSSQINKDTPPNKLIDYVSIIKSSGELLMNIIDDILDLSKLQSGVFNITKEYFNVNNMLVKSEEEYNQHIKSRGKNIKITLDLGKFSFKTYSDSNRIKQVLNNLMINAIKFTESGRIRYGYEKGDKDILFFVQDTGIGISKENITKVFERFYRVTSAGQKKQEGTGLGLTISKAIVELLGGRIWVESEVGKGSIFYFTIPIEVNDDKPQIRPKPIKMEYNWEGKKILIIEDNTTNFQLLEILMRQTKIKISHSKNGAEFFNRIKKDTYDLVLLDIQLPDISGFEILEYIKKNTKIPVIVQTAYVTQENMEKTTELGGDCFIPKPIIWKDLAKEINRLLNL